MTPHGQRCLKQLLRHDELTAAFDTLLEIPGLQGGMRISTLHTIMAIKCDDEILRYLEHIKDVWETLLQGDTSAKLLVDQATVEAVELKAPRVSTVDANVLQGQLQGGLIFGAFSDQARADIWTRLRAVEGLIPSLFTFFKDVLYLEALAGCMTRLIRLLPGDTVFTALGRAFSDTNERSERAVIQVAESHFASCPTHSFDAIDLGYRQLFAYVMRHHPQMPRDSKGKELLARPTANIDGTVLGEFADLAKRLGFHSPKITALKQNPRARIAKTPSDNSKPLLVTDGAGVKKKRRCGLPSVLEHMEDRESLFINHLHDGDEEQGEGITSFFVRKSIYLAFFGKLSPLPQDRWEQEMREQEMREQERRERQRQERLEEEEQEQEEQERPQDSSLDDERRLEDQQRIEQDELFGQGVDEEMNQASGEDVSGGQSSGVQAEVSGNTGGGINFKIYDRGIWKHAATHAIDRSNHSEIEEAATKYVREKWRLFNTELRMLAPQQCYEAVIADGTNTILLIRESEIDIDYDLLLSAMRIGVRVKEWR